MSDFDDKSESPGSSSLATKSDWSETKPPDFSTEPGSLDIKLQNCGLTETLCEVLVSALESNPSHLRELDLSFNVDLKDSGVKLLCGYLKNPDCRLETLGLTYCSLSWVSCAYLASALKSNPSYLRTLQLNDNNLQDSGVQQLSDYLKSPLCRLERLRLWDNSLTEWSCSFLASALKSNPSHLRELQLGRNDLQDSGLKLLCAVLEDPNCQLEFLGLSWCSLSEMSCASLASALKSNPTYLRELDFSYNEFQESGVKLLSGLVENPNYRLETLKAEFFIPHPMLSLPNILSVTSFDDWGGSQN
ncbi:ribonuclease inhibitor-like isoform X2 [Cheilinus undulatus]|uniref:ribonuclease inhibitor-like isoform X2 n=1 Tax=Cheilinus undulatus TaxID=241271 RepID=UPI001BD59290|nr:ribonuclease inhibitor-like isoform X2 [Cheilinus undulatus]